MTEYVIHFGVYAEEPDTFPTLAGHNDSSLEVEVHLPEDIIKAGVTKMFISGSWECWGPADQETDGGYSLHVAVVSDSISAERIADLQAFIGHGLPDDGPVTLTDHAFVTTDDWSVRTHIATFGSNPWCVVRELGKTIDSSDTSPVRQMTLDERRDAMIAQHGHMVFSIFPTLESVADGTTTYPFWYSVGRSVQGKPELLVTGPLTPDVGQWMVNAVARYQDEGNALPGEIPPKKIAEQPLRVIEADPIAANMIRAVDYAVENNVAITALQVIWPDAQGRWPGEDDFAGGSYEEPTFPKES